TPLILACENGHIEVVELLLHAKADISKRDTRGYAAIHVTVKKHNYAMLSMLLANGADA
ncbi:hypothetical protein T484DRAFT_1576558, partial [Baffinella frigidus]